MPIALATARTELAKPGSHRVAPEGENDFPIPPPHAWGTIAGTRPHVQTEDVRVNDPAIPGDLAACHVQSEVSVVAYQRNVYVGFNDGRRCLDLVGGAYTGFARSTDGGKTFEDLGPLEYSDPIGALYGDPVIALDTRGRDAGTVYLASLASSVAGDSTLAVGVSKDEGRTFRWRNAIPTPVARANHDKEWLVVDNSGSRYDGSLYLTWAQLGGDRGGIKFAYSRDGAKSWSKPVRLSKQSTQGPRVAIGPNGEIHLAWFRIYGSTKREIVWAKSTDAGKTFSRPRVVATIEAAGHQQICLVPRNVLNGDIRIMENPSVAIDTFGSPSPSASDFNPSFGDAYIVFNAGNGDDEADVFMSSLRAGEKRWSKPLRVNDDDTSTDQFLPEVVATGPGRIAVVWTDRRVDAGLPPPMGNRVMTQFVAYSRDGGRSFTKNRQLAGASFPPPYSNPNTDPMIASCYAGDYNGLDYEDGHLFAAWGDNRDDLLVHELPTPAIPDPNVYLRRLRVPK